MGLRTLRLTILIFSITAAGITLHAKDHRPTWVDTPPDAPLLFQGIGVADDTGSPEADRTRADQAAKAEIVQAISSTIQSEVRSFYEERTETGAEATRSDLAVFSSITSQYAAETIQGIEIAERYYDKDRKTYYAYATLSRAFFQEQLALKARQAVSFCQDAYRLAETALGRDDLYGAINNYAKALGELLVAQAFLKQKIEAPLEIGGRNEVLQLRLQTELMNALSKIDFAIIGGDNQSGERNRGLESPLRGRVFRTDGEPLPPMPLSIQLYGAEGEVPAIITSNSAGEFSFQVNTITAAQVARPQVQVRVAVPELAPFRDQIPYAFEVLDRKGVDFHFQMDVVSSVRVFVRVLEEINGELLSRSTTDGQLIKALLNKRYTVLDARRLGNRVNIDDLDFSILYEDYSGFAEALVDHADYAIIGIISSNDSGSSSGVLFYARADTRIVVLDLQSGRVLANSAQTQVKGAGNAALKANQAAMKLCRQDAVQEILTGLDEALK